MQQLNELLHWTQTIIYYLLALLTAVLKVPPTKQLSSHLDLFRRQSSGQHLEAGGNWWGSPEDAGGVSLWRARTGCYGNHWENLIPLLLTKFGETGTRAHAVIVTQERLKLRKWKTKITPATAARLLKHFLLYEEQAFVLSNIKCFSQPQYCVTDREEIPIHNLQVN